MNKLWNALGIIGGGLAAVIAYNSLYEQRTAYPQDFENFIVGLWAMFTNSGAWDFGIYVGPFLIGAGVVAFLMFATWQTGRARKQAAAESAATRADLLP